MQEFWSNVNNSLASNVDGGKEYPALRRAVNINNICTMREKVTDLRGSQIDKHNKSGLCCLRDLNFW